MIDLQNSLFNIVTIMYNFPPFTDFYFIDEEIYIQFVYPFTQYIVIDGLFM